VEKQMKEGTYHQKTRACNRLLDNAQRVVESESDFQMMTDLHNYQCGIEGMITENDIIHGKFANVDRFISCCQGIHDRRLVDDSESSLMPRPHASGMIP
jgi:hypothetical protein